MNVKNIHYATRFSKELIRMPKEIIILAAKKEEIFRQNPLHPSLRLHKLNGALQDLWSISISGGYRIIFKRKENGDILFYSIGTHDLYKYL